MMKEPCPISHGSELAVGTAEDSCPRCGETPVDPDHHSCPEATHPGHTAAGKKWVIATPSELHAIGVERSIRETLAAPHEDTASRPSEDPYVGKLLAGQYRVLEPIGQGGMGAVYVVEHTHLQKKFAAKILNADLARKPDAIARFELEAVSASKLDHDNIVSILNFGHGDDGTVYLIMELLRGETLEQRLRRGLPSAEETILTIIPVCRALHAAHAAGITHRDVKSDNVFLARRSGNRCVVKVLDFGVSKIKETKRADTRLTRAGQVLGSPLYMSPEASRGASDVDARADIYAVGVMLYEMFTGHPPFQADNYLQVLYMHIHDAPRPPREGCPEMSPELERVILRALEKDREKRYQTMKELEDDLLGVFPTLSPDTPLLCTEELPMGASGRITPFATGTDTRHPTHGPSLPITGPQAKRPGHLLWRGLLATAVVAVLALAWLGRSPESSRPKAVEPPPIAPATPTKVAPSPEPPRPTPPRTIVVLIETTPRGAAVAIDERPIGTSPIESTLPADGRPHVITAQHRGYRPQHRTIVAHTNQVLHLRLAPTAKPTGPAPGPELDIKGGR
jgi:serine/threonine-protein kinase